MGQAIWKSKFDSAPAALTATGATAPSIASSVGAVPFGMLLL
jgi:hypothetical protein